MGQLSTDSVITLVVGLIIGVPQLLFAILTWWEAKRSAPPSDSQLISVEFFCTLTCV
jgi:hypothetical protein